MSSIRIVSPDEVAKTAGAIPPLLFANLKSLYSRRAERLRQLAENHPLGDYLKFVATVVDAQSHAQHDHPLNIDLSETLKTSAATGNPPLSVKYFPRTQHWQQLLSAIIAELEPEAPEHVLPVLESLKKMGTQELENLATDLLTGEIGKVGSDKAPFLWAALSVYWAQMATQIPGKARADYGEGRHNCPICDSAPVASMVHIGTEAGLRYLHCSLCESEWHMVRVKCSNCEQTGKLNYWSLDSESAPVRAESCGDCGSYLKILYQEKDQYVEPVADDLASLVLDAKVEEEGFARSAVNPFLFPSGE
ncbi:formate dehydrogenase accessory protein FdhE [Limnobaculum zhutongyuii]|uniref:Protein FdhE homolog n=1 Tax=Limnobaculum zhutongyuii TaxID=2498113 RepID=A0A411WQR1_9GAMM|nr:formate dehydrogenase accessory protein FdhE [Limnobaculum zhutongyuii]QBH98470.1 formate dehydrogenase accessory protein FdhE [Limnobaculum zhutongyuii]TQS89632.1 formate dehydrogenase accessory protein FdhE [Limnobaculum zhutongyuii]